MNKKLLGLVCLSVLGASVLSGCAASTEDATVDVGVASESSALQAADVPVGPDAGPGTRASAHVRVKVKEIRIHVAGNDDSKGAGQQAADKAAATATDDAEGDGKDGGNGWVTVFTGDRTLDLDGAASLDAILGSGHAKAGKLTQVRLILDGQAVLVDAGAETPLACGSCDTSGLKIIPKGNARLEAGGHHHFVIAFDVAKSLVDEGGELRLKPVLRLALGK
jgi:hypothetical protein